MPIANEKLTASKTFTSHLQNENRSNLLPVYTGTTELAARMSELIWFDIYVLDTAFGVSSHDILSAIRDLEEGEPSTGVKPATQFKNLPLKGLWHKHYFSAHFVAMNIIWVSVKRASTSSSTRCSIPPSRP
jgi:hypothetical protein